HSRRAERDDLDASLGAGEEAAAVGEPVDAAERVVGNEDGSERPAGDVEQLDVTAGDQGERGAVRGEARRIGDESQVREHGRGLAQVGEVDVPAAATAGPAAATARQGDQRDHEDPALGVKAWRVTLYRRHEQHAGGDIAIMSTARASSARRGATSADGTPPRAPL